jgi:NADPH:quinone reductase-like Zn-dependent oxidoreductase
MLNAPGAIIGCDYAGIVEQTNPDVEDMKVGDRFAGFVHGGEMLHQVFLLN